MPRVSELAAALEAWAPPASKLDFDRVGLQVGRPDAEVSRVIVALDLTPEVVDEAEEAGAELIVTHHPLLFKPIERLVPTDFVSGLAYRLAQAGIAYYAVHTNLDAAPGGVSFALAERIGLEDLRFLHPTEGALLKLVTFVPEARTAAVRGALAEAGAGRIGDYDACAFASRGTGHFRPGDAAQPYVGEAGKPEQVEEIRLEVEVSRWDVKRVLHALREAHPYEEVAYDLYPVQQPHTRNGLGAVGSLPEAVPLADLLARIAYRLDADALRYVGDPEGEVRQVAVCGGAGSSLIGAALAAGADAYLTADVTYHTFFRPLDARGVPRMALIDAGHYETEWITETLLVDWLAERFENVEFSRTRHRTSPVRTYARSGQ